MATSKDSLKKAKEATKQATEAPLTCTWAEIQPWQRDNIYIHSGYRPATNSYYRSALSLFYVHNETVNVYTHLLPSFIFAGFCALFYRSLASRYEYASHEDRYVFACFFAGCIGCLGMSGTYHLLSNHSHAVAKFGNKLDYLGIVSLIWGSFIPSIYYGFACEPTLVKTYWTMITTIGAGCAVVSVNSTFRQPQWRTFRASMFAAMGLSAVVPVIHGVQLYGAERMDRMMGLRWVISQGALYLIGAATYAARIPERWKPGQFDIVGHSHQIFHVLVVLAAVSHLVGLIKAFDYHHSHQPSLALLCGTKPVWGKIGLPGWV